MWRPLLHLARRAPSAHSLNHYLVHTRLPRSSLALRRRVHSEPLAETSAWWGAPGTVYYDGASTHADSILTHEHGALDETRRALRDAVRRFAHDHVAPYAALIDASNRFPREQLWPRLGELGALGVTASPEHGGLGLGYTEHCLVMEELSRASASVGLSYGAHSNLCVQQIERHGTAEQKQAVLPRLCRGEWVGALAMSETGAGSDVLGSMRTVARRERVASATASAVSERWVLNGGKMWITNGPDADALVVYARTPELDMADKPAFTAFLVCPRALDGADAGRSGYRVAQKLHKLGMRGSNTCELLFEDVRLPASAVLGEPGRGAHVLMSGLDSERLVLSAGPLGIMQACLDVVLPYVAQRQQFGRPIGELPLMQAKLADMYATLSSSRAHTYTVALALDTAMRESGASGAARLRTYRRDCAAVILQNAERATQVALQAIQALGGNGYVDEYPAGRLLRDAKLYEIGAGTSEVRRILIGRELYETVRSS
ncbi:hypothetical protein CDCA_CDCA12G3507 [Cyanidium caldarium]|uniref:Isovaleryl-CoA dehydrogenase n=1 Tax=Cyanidium caldarium TaxID=2771 RepID=A0AAV9IYS6_CYACA|nr:hypothetical protein CDCA_CDCA12G3507 [Cyanidium caldarium]